MATQVTSYSLGAKMCRFLFGFNMAIAMSTAAGLIKLLYFVPGLSKGTRESISLRIVQFVWRTVLFFCSPWIPIYRDGTAARELHMFEACLGKFQETGKPVFVLGNHTSFLDTVLTVAQLPSHAIGLSRTYMSAALFDLPILSSICKGCGHFPVYFTSTEVGKFTVDKEKMSEVGKLVDQHIKTNGLLCFYPEGQMNPDPTRILPLRYGGINKALEFDACLFTFVTCGNHKVWPRKVQLGGYPANIGFSLKTVAPDGVRALVKVLRSDKSKLAEFGCDESSPDHVLLAMYGQKIMQEQYDSLVTLTTGGKHKAD
eukprot:Stramenopile-MAST_4_protein_1717